jgi:hypothetical protein
MTKHFSLLGVRSGITAMKLSIFKALALACLAIPLASQAAVTAYSTTPSANNSAPPNGAPENMAPSAVNDVMRQMMADTAIEAQKNAVKVLASVAGTNTVTGSMTPDLTGYSAGLIAIFTPAATNTGATTLNIDGLGALDVQKNDGDPLIAGDLVIGVPAIVVLDAGADDFILINPQAATLSSGVAFSDLARLSQANSFTATNRISNTAPQFIFDESDAAANNRKWDIFASVESLRMRVYNDAESAATDFIVVDRTANTVDSIALAATNVTVNGSEATRAGNLLTQVVAVDGAGSGVDADLLDGISSAGFCQTGGAGCPGTTNVTCTAACSAASIVVGQTYVAVKTSDTSRSSTTTLTADPALSFTSLPNGRYAVDFTLETSAGAGGFNFQTTGGNSNIMGFGMSSCNGGALAFDDWGNGIPNPCAGSIFYRGEGAITVTGGAPTFEIQWAQNSSNAAASTLIGATRVTFLRITRLN